MKNKIVDLILYTEKHNVGKSAFNCIKFNSAEYYAPFVELFKRDCALFEDSIALLIDGDYKTFQVEHLDYFCNERIFIHLLRLSVYFGFDCNNLKAHLKDIFICSFSMLKSTDYRISNSGMRLNLAACDFLRNIASVPPSQLFYNDPPDSLPFLDDFIVLKEVVDIHSAILYMLCSELNLVGSAPTYIKDAIKSALIVDKLYGTIPWAYYFSNTSFSKIERDIELLCKVGFSKTTLLLKSLSCEIKLRNFSTKKNKIEFCEKICHKNMEKINLCMVEEENIIDIYLTSNLNLL